MSRVFHPAKTEYPDQRKRLPPMNNSKTVAGFPKEKLDTNEIPYSNMLYDGESSMN